MYSLHFANFVGPGRVRRHRLWLWPIALRMRIAYWVRTLHFDGFVGPLAYCTLKVLAYCTLLVVRVAL